MVCSEAAADESLAAIRARIRFGIAIAAMIRMMATTISSSISEKPFCCFRISFFPSFWTFVDLMLVMVMTQSNLMMALASPNSLVTLVPTHPEQGLYFHYKAKLKLYCNALPGLGSCQKLSWN